jgi:hypothetical protein
MQDLQKAIDQYIYSETGAELVHNAKTVLGALADFVYDPHENAVAYQFLSPTETMAYDDIHGFHVQDFLVQKKEDRVVIRDTDGEIYIIRPAETQNSINAFSFHPLSENDKELIRGILTTYLRSV